MALDEPTDNDEVLADELFDVVVDKDLLAQLGGVAIDFQSNRWMGSGFSIKPAKPGGGACAC
ncbi:MAG: hypothetical protein GY854_32010 [Deltaproteobacteria bacterium]|nr:hypothetical protein [Deltaproteobacteria bacterium]